MRVDQSVPAAVLGDGQHRGGVGLEGLARAFGCHMKDAVKVGRDQPNCTLAAARQTQ